MCIINDAEDLEGDDGLVNFVGCILINVCLLPNKELEDEDLVDPRNDANRDTDVENAETVGIHPFDAVALSNNVMDDVDNNTSTDADNNQVILPL